MTRVKVILFLWDVNKAISEVMLNPLLHPSNSAPTSPMVSARRLHHAHQSPGGHRVIVLSKSNPPRREKRLSRVVKCKTMDFTEFPEGMREYSYKFTNLIHTPNANKVQVRECRSQPASPIPRIKVQDFGPFWVRMLKIKEIFGSLSI